MKLTVPLVGFMLAAVSCPAYAAQWSAETHSLTPGDFNGDGKSDLLVIAKDPSLPSGLALGNGSGQPSAMHQVWASGYLGITWSLDTYLPRVGDFNGDNRDDVLLQRASGGNHYLLVADASSKFTAIQQTITNSSLGVAWSLTERRIEVGNFNNDLYDDLFLQSKILSVDNAVVLGTGGGFTAVNHTWANAYLSLEWSEPRALDYAGEFNGDGYADLFVHAKPNWVMIPFEDLVIPVPVYRSESNATVASDGTGKAATVLDTWSHDYLGIKWSALNYDAFVENFDGVCGDDILLQAKQSGGASYIVLTACGGTVPSGATVHTLVNGELGLAWDTASYQFRVGDFDGNGRADIYMQALTPGGTSRIAYTAAGGDITTAPVVHDPSAITYGFTPEYDALGRVEKITYEDGSYVEYDYDDAGNRTAVTGVKN